MKNNNLYLKQAKKALISQQYKKALSIYNFFHVINAELSKFIDININIVSKKLRSNEIMAANMAKIVMKIPVYNNFEYMKECFQKVIQQSPVDVMIEYVPGDAANSFLLAYFNRDCFDFESCVGSEERGQLLHKFLHATNFFDEKFYLAQYKINVEGGTAAEHFFSTGFAEGNLPARWFDLHFCTESELMVTKKIIHDNSKLPVHSFHTGKPKVSVIIPVYNNALYLNECIDSVINQTLNEIEIIIVNDGSTDSKVLEVLNEYAQKNDRIVLIHKKNTGYGHTMNVGLLAATGEYIGIVESDDYILENMYENLVCTAKNNELDFIKSNFFIFYGDGAARRLVERSLSLDKKHYKKIINPNENPSVFNMHNINTCGIFLKEFIDKNNIKFNETPGASFQDNGFWFQTFIFAKKIFVSNNSYYCIRRDNENSSVFNREKVYCITDEYSYIRKILNKNPKLREKFLPILNARKWSGCIFTLNRIGDEYKKPFVAHIAKEYSDALKNGELKKEILGNNVFSNIMQLIKSPDTFLKNHLEKSSKNGENITIQKEQRVKVSVVMPVYNSELYLKNCLDSILGQTLREIEVICIDDGSTDSSNDILQKCALQDSRLIVLKQENLGAGSARNKGLSISNGKYLFFSDSDDYFELSLLEKMYENAELMNSDFCVCLTDLNCMKTGEIVRCTYSLREDIRNVTHSFDYTKIEGNIFRAMMGWAFDKLYNRDFIMANNIKFQEIRIHNDMTFVFSGLLHAKSISVVNDVLVHKRISLDGQITNTKQYYWRCFYDALMLLKQICKDAGVYNNVKRSYINYALHIIYRYNEVLKGSIHFDEFCLFLKFKVLKSINFFVNSEDYYWNKKEYTSVFNLLNKGTPDEK